jgi:phage regulator Rha-like protein
MTKKIHLHPDEAIILNIRHIRWQKVLLDRDLAVLYGVATKRLNEAVKRNIDRFPEDFMFQLTENEFASSISSNAHSETSWEQGSLISQNVISNILLPEADFMPPPQETKSGSYIWYEHITDINRIEDSLRSQIATSNISASEPTSSRWGNRRLPYAFTEQGIAMLSSVLNSPTAIRINIQIIRIFVNMRTMLAQHRELQTRIEEIEQSLGSTNQSVKELYDLFIQLVVQDVDDNERKIGFRTR